MSKVNVTGPTPPFTGIGEPPGNFQMPLDAWNRWYWRVRTWSATAHVTYSAHNPVDGSAINYDGDVNFTDVPSILFGGSAGVAREIDIVSQFTSFLPRFQVYLTPETTGPAAAGVQLKVVYFAGASVTVRQAVAYLNLEVRISVEAMRGEALAPYPSAAANNLPGFGQPLGEDTAAFGADALVDDKTFSLSGAQRYASLGTVTVTNLKMTPKTFWSYNGLYSTTSG